MIKGACHCGAVEFTYDAEPEWLTSCNCSICSKLGAIWAHSEIENITLSYDPEDVTEYVWGNQSLAFVTCRLCGCTTHWESLDPENSNWMAVNMRMAPVEVMEGIQIRNFDGAESWRYFD